MTDTPSATNGSKRIFIDRQNYCYVDGVKLFRYIPEHQALEFVDRSRMRSEARGSRFIEVGIVDLLHELRENS